MVLFAKFMEPMEKCLRHAKMDKSFVHGVVLVGRPIKIPKVHQLLQDFSNGKVLLCRLQSLAIHRMLENGATINGWTVL